MGGLAITKIDLCFSVNRSNLYYQVGQIKPVENYFVRIYKEGGEDV